MRCKLIRYRLLMLIPLFYMQSATADVAIGRLFFTLEERERLDQLRAIKTSKIKPRVESGPSKAAMQGYVKRNDGKQNTVWIGGIILQEDANRHDFE